MTKRLNIALMGLRGIPSNYGGFETFAEEIAPRLVDRGHYVTVYGRSNNIHYRLPFYRGIRLKILPTIPQKYLDTVAHTLLASIHAVLFESFDVILMVNAANALFVPICRLRGAKVALNVDGIERLRKKWGPAGQFYYRLAEHLAARLPNVIVSDAKSIARYYREKHGVNSNIITYGAETRRIPVGQTLSSLGVYANEYVLFVSRLEPENNADLLLQAYSKVKTDLPLLVVGDAPYSTDFKHRLQSLAGLDPRVKLLGAIYGTGYRELISNARVYVQTTEVGGTHPALLEAMGVGNCVVANCVPEHEEVLSGSGLLYEKNNIDDMARNIQLALDDEVMRAELGVRASARIANYYRWDDITDQYLDMFHAMVSSQDLSNLSTHSSHMA